MNITTFVKWAAFGVALGGIEDYISRKKGDAIKQKIDEWQAKVEIKRNRTNEPTINYIPEEQPIESEVIEDPDLPWETQQKAYTKLSEILDSEDYKVESEEENYIQNTYSEAELKAIYEAEQALAEEEAPEDDEPTNEELEGYYNPEDDLYDTQDNYIPDEDEGELETTNAIHEIDEDEFNNSSYEVEEYYYYGDVDYFCDDEKNHLCGYREVEELFGVDAFRKLKSGQPVIFLRNDFLESCYKITYIAGEYDR